MSLIQLHESFYNILDNQYSLAESTESYEYVPLFDKNSIDYDSKEFEFEYSGTESYIHPHNSYIYVKLQVLNSDKSNLAQTDDVTLQNNGYNIFSRARYYIEGKEIEDVDYVGINTLINNLIDFSEDFSKSSATNMLWYKDTSDSTETNRFTTSETGAPTNSKSLIESIKPNTNFNEGYTQRKIITKNSNTFTLLLPLNRLFGFCKSINKVFRGSRHRIILNKNDESNIFHTSSSTKKYFLKIKDMKWYIPKVISGLFSISYIEDQISKDFSMELWFKSSKVYRSNEYNNDQKSETWKVCTTQNRPMHLFFAFQKKSRYEPDQLKSCMIFDHMNLQTLRVTINDSYKYPEQEYECDFSNNSNDYSRVYFDLLSAGYKNNTDMGTCISMTDFKRLYPIFHVDISKKPLAVYESNLTEINLTYKLSQNSDEKYKIYCMVMSDNKMIMDIVNRKIIIR